MFISDCCKKRVKSRGKLLVCTECGKKVMSATYSSIKEVPKKKVEVALDNK